MINGLIVTKMKLPPFLVTLGTLSASLGFARIIAKGASAVYVPIHVQTWIGAKTEFQDEGLGRLVRPLILFRLLFIVGPAIADCHRPHFFKLLPERL